MRKPQPVVPSRSQAGRPARPTHVPPFNGLQDPACLACELGRPWQGAECCPRSRLWGAEASTQTRAERGSVCLHAAIRVVLGCTPVQSSMPVTETLAVWNNKTWKIVAAQMTHRVRLSSRKKLEREVTQGGHGGRNEEVPSS
jgi:hypothetical protein